MKRAEVWQANMGRGVSVGEWRDNLAAVVEAAGLSGIVAWQEIDEADEPDERADLRAETDGSHRLFHGHRLNPISVPYGADVVDFGSTYGCDGLAKVTPARWITYVVVKLAEGLTLAVVNFHMPRDVPGTRTRRARMRHALSRLVRRLRRAGHIVYLAGDTNTRGRFAAWTAKIRAAVASTIDRSWITAPRRHPWQLARLATMRVGLTIDGHDAHGAVLGFRRRRRAA